MGNRYLPHIGFILVYVLWGINMSSMKVGGREWDPFVFNGLRYLSILPLLWLYAYWHYRRSRDQREEARSWRMSRRDLWLLLGLGVLSAIGMEAMLSYALQYSNTANGAVLGRGFMPIVTAVIALLLREVVISWRMALGLPVALAGVVVMVAAGGELGFTEETLRGDMLLLLRSVLGAVYLIGMNRLVKKYPLALLLALEMTAGAVSLLPWVVLHVDAAYIAAVSTTGWISLIYTAFITTAVGFALHNWSLARIGPYKASVYGYLLPFTAAVSGMLLLGERLSAAEYAGAAAILAAMYLVQRDRMQTLKPHAASAKPAARSESQGGSSIGR